MKLWQFEDWAKELAGVDPGRLMQTCKENGLDCRGLDSMRPIVPANEMERAQELAIALRDNKPIAAPKPKRKRKKNKG